MQVSDMKKSTNPHLTLSQLLFESIQIGLPRFPTEGKATPVKFQPSAQTLLYLSRLSKDRFALRLRLDLRKGKNKRSKSGDFSFKMSVIGLFQFAPNDLTHKRKIAYVEKRGPSLILQEVPKYLNPILQNSLLRNFKFPKVGLQL
jgi:hypothetical protein